MFQLMQKLSYPLSLFPLSQYPTVCTMYVNLPSPTAPPDFDVGHRFHRNNVRSGNLSFCELLARCPYTLCIRKAVFLRGAPMRGNDINQGK